MIKRYHNILFLLLIIILGCEKDDICIEGSENTSRITIGFIDYENKGDKILLVCNRGTEGYGGGGKPAHIWARETIEELIKHTEKNFIVRFHKANMHDKNEDVKKLIEWTSNDSKLSSSFKIFD